MTRQEYANGAVVWYFSDDGLVVSQNIKDVEAYEQLLSAAEPQVATTGIVSYKDTEETYKVYKAFTINDFKKIVSNETINSKKLDTDAKKAFWSMYEPGITVWVVLKSKVGELLDILPETQFITLLQKRQDYYHKIVSQYDAILHTFIS